MPETIRVYKIDPHSVPTQEMFRLFRANGYKINISPVDGLENTWDLIFSGINPTQVLQSLSTLASIKVVNDENDQ